MIDRLLFRKRRAEQRAAKQEVLEEIRQNPIGGFGLYQLLDDAGLISRDAKKELKPLITSIEQRLHLDDEALKISLPMPFEPITDVEYDTLTAVIGKALREFARALPHLDEQLRLVELLGINDTLQRHVPHTAAIVYEVSLEQILHPLLLYCGKHLPFYRPDRMSNAQPGDFFRITELRRSKQKFSRKFIEERNIDEGEIVQVDEVWDKGYLRAQRLTRTSKYSREWRFDYLQRSLPNEEQLTAVHKDEGELYRLNTKYEGAVIRFIGLYQAHMEDQSIDPTTYQPTGPRKE